MNVLSFQLLFFFNFFPTILPASIYQRCTQLSTQYTLFTDSSDIPETLVAFSANFDYIKLLSSSFDIIIIGNISTFADYREIDVLQEIDSYVDDVDDVCWLDSGCQLYVEDSRLALFLNAQNGSDIQNFLIFRGLADEKSLSLDDGFIFSTDNSCHTKTEDSSFGNQNVKAKFQSCCTSFDPPSSLPSAASKCLEFQSRSTIYNTNDSFSIFATMKAEYFLEGEEENGMKIRTNYSGPEGSTYQLSANGVTHCNGNNNNTFGECNFPLGNFNTKILFNVRMQMVDIAGSDSWEFDFNGGRLIIFENETLMAEGTPFTAQNDCLYMSHSYKSVSKVAQSQFCCTTFSISK